MDIEPSQNRPSKPALQRRVPKPVQLVPPDQEPHNAIAENADAVIKKQRSPFDRTALRLGHDV